MIKLKEKENVLYLYLFYLLTLAFIGWVFETSAVFLETWDLTDRGYLFISFIDGHRIYWGLPAIDMYGIGGVIIIVLLEKYRNQYFKLFFYGMISMSIFEVIGSLWCEYVLHQIYWDYSNDFMNFYGRVCIRTALAWGVLSIVLIQLVLPCLKIIYNRWSMHKNFRKIIAVATIYFIFCGFLKYVVDPSLVAN